MDESEKIQGGSGAERDDSASRSTRRSDVADETPDRYRALFETFADAIYTAGLDGYLRDANPAAVSLLGFDSKKELLGTDPTRLYANPRDRDKFLARLFAEGSIRDVSLRVRRRDGKELEVIETASVVRNSEGRAVGYQGVFRDVTVQRKLERQLIESQRLEAVARVAGGIAHDFNNLLTVIAGFSDLARSQLEEGDALAEDIGEIQAAVGRATALTQQLIAISRSQTLEPRLLDPREVVRSAQRAVRRALGPAIDLDLSVDEEVGQVRVDPTRLEQVLVDLAAKAREGMPEGGRVVLGARDVRFAEPGEVRGVILVPGDYTVISMSDDGPGMDEDSLGHLFEPFFTAKQGGKARGLDLATAYGIVKQSAGYIFVESALGRGTTFTVYLPHAEADTLASEPDSFPLSAGRGSELVLLVDDDTAVRGFTVRGLESCGYEVIEADGFQAAREQCLRRGHEIDLLLTDLVMPGRDGAALALEVRERYPNIRILLMSGYAGRVLENSGLEDGEIAFLQKPFTIKQLRRGVRAVLDAD